MFYLGLDVHSKWSTIKGFDPDTGEVVEFKRVPNPALAEVVVRLAGPRHGVLETGTNAGAVHRQLRPYFERLVMADPVELWEGKRRGGKTDSRDALAMAQKLYHGQIKAVYVPDERTQDLRALTRSKIRATRWVTRLVNEMGSLLRMWGYVLPASLLSAKGARFMASVELPTHSTRVLKLWQEMLAKAQELERELEREVSRQAAADPQCRLLQTMPGVGPFTALVTRAELGDINRFADDKALVSYGGLVAQVWQTSEHFHYGRCGPGGNRWLRYALVLLANRVARSRQDHRLRRLYWRVCLSCNKSNPAKMAVARKALQLMYHMLKRGEVFRDLPEQKSSAA